ncbi:MAG: hypothetical protein IH957_13565 [Chloroflexi bacterium]|nr:hypothetical protein [Chloroflexota bacterium]
MPHRFATATEIANMALSHLGKDTIENRTEQTPEGEQVRIWYDYSRRMVLEVYDWNFARGRLTAALHGDTISETATDPMAGVWGYRYQYPNDCVMMRKIQNPSAPPADAIPFEVELNLDRTQRSILTDQEDAVLVYTADIENTDLFSGLFVLAFSHLLASHMAFALTGKVKIADGQMNKFRGVLPAATAASANEAVSAPPRDVDWIRDRA